MASQIARLILQWLPGVVTGIETVFMGRKGTEKEDSMVTAVRSLLFIIHQVSPEAVGEAEITLAKEVTASLVKYYNERGEFKHGS